MLFGVNFRPLQEIEAKIEGGQIFDAGPFFGRLRYYNLLYWWMVKFVKELSVLIHHHYCKLYEMQWYCEVSLSKWIFST